MEIIGLIIILMVTLSVAIYIRTRKPNKCFVAISETETEVKLYINNELKHSTEIKLGATKDEKYDEIIKYIVLHQKANKIINENTELSKTIPNRCRRFIGQKKMIMMHHEVITINSVKMSMNDAVAAYKRDLL